MIKGLLYVPQHKMPYVPLSPRLNCTMATATSVIVLAHTEWVNDMGSVLTTLLMLCNLRVIPTTA